MRPSRRLLLAMAALVWSATGCGTAVPMLPTTGSVTPPPSQVPAAPAPTGPPPTAPAPVPTGCDNPVCYSVATEDGVLPTAVGEASGIAASRTDPDLYFVVDDAAGTDEILAVRSDGTLVASITVDGMSVDNAEALSAGVCEAGSARRCLYVGDIGGNAGRRTVTVHRLAEPTVPLPASTAADRWKYRYPDGAYDAEAMLVTDAGDIVVVTKPEGGTLPHRVYVGPPGGGELVLHSSFRPPAPISARQSRLVGNVVTDAARAAGAVLLLTYDQVVEYRSPDPAADPADFAEWPWRQLPSPRQWQSEGITPWAADGCGYLVVSERSPFGGPAIGSVSCA